MNDDYSVTWGPIGPGIPWQWKQKTIIKSQWSLIF